jgi:hypothetical protein
VLGGGHASPLPCFCPSLRILILILILCPCNTAPAQSPPDIDRWTDVDDIKNASRSLCPPIFPPHPLSESNRKPPYPSPTRHITFPPRSHPLPRPEISLLSTDFPCTRPQRPCSTPSSSRQKPLGFPPEIPPHCTGTMRSSRAENKENRSDKPRLDCPLERRNPGSEIAETHANHPARSVTSGNTRLTRRRPCNQ